MCGYGRVLMWCKTAMVAVRNLVPFFLPKYLTACRVILNWWEKKREGEGWKKRGSVLLIKIDSCAGRKSFLSICAFISEHLARLPFIFCDVCAWVYTGFFVVARG